MEQKNSMSLSFQVLTIRHRYGGSPNNVGHIEANQELLAGRRGDREGAGQYINKNLFESTWLHCTFFNRKLNGPLDHG